MELGKSENDNHAYNYFYKKDRLFGGPVKEWSYNALIFSAIYLLSFFKYAEQTAGDALNILEDVFPV